MKTRRLKVLFTKGGSGSTTTRLGLPSTWVREMGISENEREVEVMFDGEKITIQKLDCNRFYDGSIVDMKNLKKILQDDRNDGDMTTEEIDTIKSFVQYDSEEDFEYLLEKLQEKNVDGYIYNEVNWQTIYSIISQGEWNYNS